ncbi:MAG: outer membrane protein assembly factor BamE [Beijerinckiaceae bacterium]|jgi:outer membrane protein assembly factor BamE (lipoprotein component of BamABCDE complex)|nr:outer membrane protein assembly factor BamE [Beijerinckiaceae bacterium]
MRISKPTTPARGITHLARIAMACAALAAPAALGGCLGYDGSVYHGYIIDGNAISQVRPGSSAEQVLVVLGSPTTTSTVGGDAWYYISQKSTRQVAFMKREINDQRVLAVYYDKTKRVERIANYGMRDGKLFDFISRTTPTAGSEPSFVRNMMSNLLRFN